MRIKILILLMFAAFRAQGQTIIPLAGNTRDTVRVKGNLRTDSTMRCLGLVNLNGDNYKLTTDATGKFILRPDLGGSASTDDQQLTISNDTIFLEDGGYVVLPASGVTIDTTSLSNRINQRVKYTDTAAMLANYINAVTYGLIKTGKSIRADTSQLVTQYDLTQLVDNNTTYTAGFGLDLSGTQFLVDTGEIRTVANSFNKAQYLSILADTADAIRDDFPAVLNNPDSTLPGWGLLENNNTIYVDTGAGKVATAYDVSLKVNYTDTGAMLLPYITENEVLAIIDDTAAAIRADIPDVTGFATQQALEDTAAAIRADFPTFSVPTLEQVLGAGNSDTLGTITLYDGAVSARLHQWSNTTNTHIVSVSAPSTTASRNIQWPDANGTAVLHNNQQTLTLKNYSNPVVSNLPWMAVPDTVIVLDNDTLKRALVSAGGGGGGENLDQTMAIGAVLSANRTLDLDGFDFTIDYGGGNFIISDGNEAAGKVLQSDASGKANWATPDVTQTELDNSTEKDGDKGDISVASGVWTIDNAVISAAKMAAQSSANVAGWVSDETGSGALVFGTSPTIVTPTIASLANANHNHTNSAGGGQLTDAALSSAVTVPKGGTGLTSTTAYALFAGGTTSTGNLQQVSGLGTSGQHLISNGAGALPTWQTPTRTNTIIIACSDLTTAITTGTTKAYFRMPAAATVTAVRASLLTAGSSGTVTVDINESGTTILSTKLTIDVSEKTSVTAATPYVISDASIAADAEMTIDFDAISTNAAGLIVEIDYTY